MRPRHSTADVIRQAAKEEAHTPHPELARVELQIRELERLRREGILSAEVAGVALKQAYRDREALLRAPGAEVIDPVFGAEAAYLETMDQLEAVLEGEDAAQAREALREVIDSIQLHPREGVLWAELRTGRQLALVNWNGSGGSIWTQLTGDRAA